MASHHISLAKAAFGASLFRPDVTKVSRDDLFKFQNAFEAALVTCSRHNIQTCNQWLIDHVIVSATRASALGKYLVTLSRHLATHAGDIVKPSVQRRRLHLVYLLNDLLHHAKYHTSDRALQTNLSQSLQPYIEELLQLAAVDAKRGVSRRLRDLASIWEEENYFDRQDLTQLLDPSASTLPNSHAHPRQQAKSESTVKELPYILPSSHGDPSLPFYDLPAGNLVRLIVPNSSQPMRPEEVRPLQLASGPVDEGLVNALKDFLADVQGMENTRPKPEDGGVAPDMDEMGQMSYHDEAGGLAGDTYYGWSRSFCEKMKRRRVGPGAQVEVAAGFLESAGVTASLRMDVRDRHDPTADLVQDREARKTADEDGVGVQLEVVPDQGLDHILRKEVTI